MAVKPFEIIYSASIKQHLWAIERKYHAMIRAQIEAQLTFQPEVETRNRKPIRQPDILTASWEIRFGLNNQFRFFYDVQREKQQVWILAIGRKEGNRVIIGEESIEL